MVALDIFLPVSRKEISQRGWEQPDFVLVTGDAYVDHSSFGAAIIGRVLERRGYRVAVLSQPRWHDTTDFIALGEPRLAFLVTSGNIDSMVNHYTAARKKRSQDAYSPGGVPGRRPDRATILYSQRAKEAYPHVPVVLGGLEASLRRLAHYDYWSNKVRRSILLDSRADLLVYGMGERQVVEIAEALDSGLPVGEITFIRGTVCKTRDRSRFHQPLVLPHYDEILKSPREFARSFAMQLADTDNLAGRPLVEPYRNWDVVQNPPALPLAQQELDDVYSLPYMREAHPMYRREGGVPALEEVQFSLVSSRGCFGGCSFCALHYHQGRVVQSRSHQSVLQEAEKLLKHPQFKGYIHDVGGPTANFRQPACQRQAEKGACPHRQCLFPGPCENLVVDHSDYLSLLRKLRKLPGVKKVFIRSGIRYDYLVYDDDETFFRELCQHHISGQLKVAPEHVSAGVLEKMGKPPREVYDNFVEKFFRINRELGKEQYLVPYLITGHPGSTLDDAIELALYLRQTGYVPEQVQDFYPTPGTLSTCMYHTGIDPRTMEPVYVAKTPREKAWQRALVQFNNPRNRKLVREALSAAGRTDLFPLLLSGRRRRKK